MEDPAQIIITELQASWLKANTGGYKPSINLIYDVKREDVGINPSDSVLAYATTHIERPASLGFDTIDYTDHVSIDVRTTASRTRMNQLRDEARRIIYNKRKSLSGYKLLTIDNGTDLSDRSIKLWRYIIDVRMWKVITTVPS